jgi:MFS superfamily sulfate permease-like transporter
MHVIKVSPSRFLFFAGWQWFDTTSTDHSKEINAIVHDDVSQEKIVNFSWAYVLTKLLSDLHRDSNLYQLVSTIDKMPNEIRKYLFKENYSHSAIKTAMRITNESRSAIRNHMSKNRFQTERSRSILDELLEDG